jgi:hypothetical protein
LRKGVGYGYAWRVVFGWEGRDAEVDSRGQECSFIGGSAKCGESLGFGREVERRGVWSEAGGGGAQFQLEDKKED